MSQSKVLVFAGSTRKESYNKKLAAIAAEALREAGAEVTLIDLKDFPMPIYDGDLEDESGLPENAKKLKALFLQHDGLLISSPEYNSSISGVLKNSLDWISRAETETEPSLVAYRGKIAALTSASPGGLGGLRGLIALRSMLGNIGVTVLPDQVTLSAAYEAFDDAGQLKDARKTGQIKELAKSLVTFLDKLKG